MANEQPLVGQSVRRLDAFEKVTGTIRYGIDLAVPGMLYARTKRSPHPHARILKIDTTDAARLPGVEVVVTAADIQGTNRHGIDKKDQPVLVPLYDRVRMIGDPVAAVAARTGEIADEALHLIQVEYEELLPVTTVQAALEPNAPRLFEDHPRNVCSEYHYMRGDVEQGWAEADVITEDVFDLPRQEHA